MPEIPAGLVTEAVANVTAFLAQGPVLAILGIVIGLPASFWIIKKLKSVFFRG